MHISVCMFRYPNHLTGSVKFDMMESAVCSKSCGANLMLVCVGDCDCNSNFAWSSDWTRSNFSKVAYRTKRNCILHEM